MARPSRLPDYPRAAHSSGQARVYYKGRDYYLGVFDSPESHAEYNRLRIEWTNSLGQPAAPPAPSRDAPVTVNQVIAAWDAAIVAERGEDYRDLAEYRRGLVVLSRLYGHTEAAAFDAGRLEQVLQAMASASWMTEEEKEVRRKRKKPCEWCRNVCNHQLVRIRTVWRWAESKGLAPRGIWAHLKTVRGFTKKSQKVRQTPARTAVEWEQVVPILDRVQPVVAAMIELQWEAGLRPGEVIRIRVRDITKDGPDGTWLYWLDGWKNDWRPGEECGEAAVLGEEALRILRPWYEASLSRGRDAYVFPPARRRLHQHYTLAAYDRAVTRACDELGVARWTPYQLRHAAKRRITREHGLDVARAQLRQKSLGTTNEYDKQQDRELAARAAKANSRKNDENP